MNRLHQAPLLPFFVLLTAGCGAEGVGDEWTEDDEDVTEAGSALCTENGLAPNGLAPNGLAPNGLAPNGLAPNGLAPNGLAPNGMAVLQEDSLVGQMSRDLVRYTVSCALEPGQSFAFSWTDNLGVVHDEAYPGQLGLAPGWATAPLTDETQQRMVSACLAARTNWYGVSVVLSLRSKLKPLRTAVPGTELADYSNVEGAFWGNLFTPTPYLHSCYEAANVDVARAANRDCAAGHLDANGQPTECGVIDILGPCSDWCQDLDNHERWYKSCDDPTLPGTPSTKAVIAVALP